MAYRGPDGLVVYEQNKALQREVDSLRYELARAQDGDPYRAKNALAIQAVGCAAAYTGLAGLMSLWDMPFMGHPYLALFLVLASAFWRMLG